MVTFQSPCFSGQLLCSSDGGCLQYCNNEASAGRAVLLKKDFIMFNLTSPSHSDDISYTITPQSHCDDSGHSH